MFVDTFNYSVKEISVKRTLLILILLTLIILVAQAQDESVNRNDLIPDLMSEINVWRLNANLEPLVYNPVLEQLAIAQADYLISLSPFPNDIHAGRNGESPRQRSQYPEFAWPTYGHPELFAVTEIAAIGSIASAMNFWQNSDIHTRSALNPTYREVGVAARQHGSDVLFIVVLGGQPNALPALPDPDENTLYLTNERNDWQGDWLGVATQYRLLDSTLDPLTNWLEWEPNIDLPEVSEDFFYIQYQDGENRTTSRIPLVPVWWLSDEDRALAMLIQETNLEPAEADIELVDEAIAALPTGTPTSTPTATPEQESIFVTSTPLPTLTPLPSPTIVVPTLTPRPQGFVRLEYDENYLTLVNSSPAIVDLYGMTLGNDAFRYNVLTWEVPADEINIGAVPSNHCLQLAGFNTNSGINFLPDCNFVRSFVTISEDNFFWTEGTFDVRFGDDVVATCSADENVCEFEVN